MKQHRFILYQNVHTNATPDLNDFEIKNCLDAMRLFSSRTNDTQTMDCFLGNKKSRVPFIACTQGKSRFYQETPGYGTLNGDPYRL
jgi:hypothetical protein